MLSEPQAFNLLPKRTDPEAKRHLALWAVRGDLFPALQLNMKLAASASDPKQNGTQVNACYKEPPLTYRMVASQGGSEV